MDAKTSKYPLTARTRRTSGTSRRTGSCTVFNTGGSMAVTLPKEFADKYMLRKGDPLPYIINGNTIKFIPVDENHPIMAGRKSGS